MKKLLLVSMVVLLVFAFAAPGAADPTGEGFVLANTDAAYAEFTDGEGCDLFVGYVWAKTLKWFDRPGVTSPHTDVDVKLSGTCTNMEGTLNTLGNTLVGIVKLDSAFIDGVVVPLGGDYTALVDLEWTATGDTYNQNFNEPGMRANHRTRDADVTGTVKIMEGTTILRTFHAPADVWWSIITHYTEIQRPNLP